MARRKRVHYKPDAFQAHGRRVAEAIQSRGAVVVACAALVVVAFIVAFAILRVGSVAEENASTAFFYAGNDARKLERALAEYGSTSARPHMLLALGRAELERPADTADPSDGDGDAQPAKAEPPEKRKARLARAEKALRALAEEYPDHDLHMHGLSLLGLTLEEQGRHEDAAAVFEKALAKASEVLDPKLRYDIGRNYVLTGKPELLEKARPLLKRASDAGRIVSTGRGRATADWIENARHLKARIGPGERAVRFRKPAPEEKAGDEGTDSAEPANEKAADEKTTDEKATGNKTTDRKTPEEKPGQEGTGDGKADGEGEASPTE